MGLIARGTKTGVGTGDFASGLLIRSAEVNTDFNTIYAEFNGNIDNANIKASAGILGTKIASAPNGISTTQLNDLAVTTAKINDLAVTKGKVNNSELTLAQLNIVEETVIVAGVGISASAQNFSISPTTKPVATLELIGVYVRRVIINSGSPGITMYGITTTDAGTNWAGTLYTIGTGSGNVDFRVTWVFITKS